MTYPASNLSFLAKHTWWSFMTPLRSSGHTFLLWLLLQQPLLPGVSWPPSLSEVGPLTCARWAIPAHAHAKIFYRVNPSRIYGAENTEQILPSPMPWGTDLTCVLQGFSEVPSGTEPQRPRALVNFHNSQWHWLPDLCWPLHSHSLKSMSKCKPCVWFHFYENPSFDNRKNIEFLNPFQWTCDMTKVRKIFMGQPLEKIHIQKGEQAARSGGTCWLVVVQRGGFTERHGNRR